MNLIDCDETHAAAIAAIFNHEIASSTTFYETEPRTHAWVVDWLEAKRRDGCPVIGVVTDGGVLRGFATFGPFRPQFGYRQTVEHSVYVEAASRGGGVGRWLLEAITARAREAGCRAMIGVIDADNAASRGLHEAAGFQLAGKLDQVGHKFDRWLDVCFYQKVLVEPDAAADGGPSDAV